MPFGEFPPPNGDGRESQQDQDGWREETGWDIRYYTLPEVTAILKEIGFSIRRVCGDYDESAYTLDSKRLITVACKD